MALLITVLLSLWIPRNVSRYRIRLQKTEIVSVGTHMYMEDLDGDGAKERIVVGPNIRDEASYMIESSKGELINQWNLSSRFLSKDQRLYFTDLNRDDYQEIVNFTHRGDTIFINILQPLGPGAFEWFLHPIDTIGNYDPEFDYSRGTDVRALSLIQDSREGRDSILYFALEAGYSGYPRNLYALDLSRDSLRKSAHLGNRLSDFRLSDLDGDGSIEFVLTTISAGNDRWFHRSYFERTDSSSWMIVLNEDFDFYFPPKEYPTELSAIQLDTLQWDGDTQILAAFHSKRQGEIPSQLLILDRRGRELKTRRLGESGLRLYLDHEGKQMLLHHESKGRIRRFDFQLNEREEIKMPPASVLVPLDLDGNGHDEWLAFHPNDGALRVYTNAFGSESEFQFPDGAVEGPFDFGTYEREGKTFGWFYSNAVLHSLQYGLNPMFYWRFGLYPLLYGVVFGLVFLITRAREWQDRRERQIERKMAELQLRTIKNQMDPHFVFNAMNTIADMRLTDRWEADRFIGEFSDLMRRTISGSDKVIYTLKEEIEYIENYIRLQVLRLGFEFRHRIEVGPSVDLGQEVPKHILYSFVENAIKHGLALKGENGLLLIQVDREGDRLRLTVFNNGMLDGSGAMEVASTGNGMRIMQELFDLYEIRYHRKVSLQVRPNYQWEGERGYFVELVIE